MQPGYEVEWRKLQFFSDLNTYATAFDLRWIQHNLARRGGVMSIFMVFFVILLIAWLLGFSVFHAAGALIHILLIVAVIALILHFVTARRGVA